MRHRLEGPNLPTPPRGGPRPLPRAVAGRSSELRIAAGRAPGIRCTPPGEGPRSPPRAARVGTHLRRALEESTRRLRDHLLTDGGWRPPPCAITWRYPRAVPRDPLLAHAWTVDSRQETSERTSLASPGPALARRRGRPSPPRWSKAATPPLPPRWCKDTAAGADRIGPAPGLLDSSAPSWRTSFSPSASSCGWGLHPLVLPLFPILHSTPGSVALWNFLASHLHLNLLFRV